MSRATVLAEFLGLTPETHPWAYRDGYFCEVCGVESHTRCDCLNRTSFYARREVLNLPDPLAPGTEADAWLGVLVRTKDFWTIHAFTDGFGANVFREGWRSPFGGEAPDPTPAIVRAMMAADSTFAAKMEGAEGC